MHKNQYASGLFGPYSLRSENMKSRRLLFTFLAISCSFVGLLEDAHAQTNGGAQDFSFAARFNGSGGVESGSGAYSAVLLPITNGVFEVNISATCAYAPSQRNAKHTITIVVLDSAVGDIKDSGHRRYTRTVTTYDNIATIMTGPMVGYFRQDQSSFGIECNSDPADTLVYKEILALGRAQGVPANQTFEPLPNNPILVKSPRQNGQ